MSFTKALYYPSVDIRNWDWAKSVALLWDNIQTIVPDSIETPYKNRVTEVLSSEGILIPFNVNSDLPIVKSLSEDVWKFLDTNEGFDLLIGGNNRHSLINKDKLPREVRDLSTIHPEKLPNTIRWMLEEEFGKGNRLKVDSKFASFYMTLLANKICEEKRLILLTDDSSASNVAEKARFDNHRKLNEGREYFYGSDERPKITAEHLSQGMLTSLALKGIRFSPDTKIEDILKFKGKHKDELGVFRTNLTKLVSDVHHEGSYEAIQNHVQAIYVNDFLPSYNNFKKALKGFKLKWVNDHLMKIAFFKGGTTLVPYLLGASIPQALLAGAGVSVITSAISYNHDKKKMLQDSPYSYLISAENELNKEDFKKALRNTIF